MELRRDHQFRLRDLDLEDSAPLDLPFDLNNLDFNRDPLALLKKIGGPGTNIPIPEAWSAAEVRQEARSRSDAVFTYCTVLNKILQRHEASIQKRWVKKTRQQRLNILLKAWPGMPATHRPDFHAFRKNKKGPENQEAYMWPYINQEDLVKTKTLLLLLNSRGRHPLSHFAAADNEAMRLGKITQGIIPIFLNEHVMILNGFTTNTHDYGALVEWGEHPEAFDWMANRKQFMPGEGLLILQVQQRILSFLIECCAQILHDIPEHTSISDLYPILPEPQLKSGTEITGFESLAVMAAEAPYRVPGQLDLGRVVSLLSARTSAAEDHIWALREDPDYFLRQFLEIKEHRQEMLKDSNGKDHHVFSGREDVFWARVIGTIVWESYSDLEIFSKLSEQAKQLELLQQKYTAEISPDKDLPAEYLEAFIRFRYYIDQAAKAPLLKLSRSAQAAPPMRKFFVRIPPPDTQTTMIGVMTKPGTKMNNIEHELIWLLHTLGQDDKPLFFASLPLIVDELERLIQSEKQAQVLLTAYLTEVISDLSIISQCQNQLNLYQPWAQRWDLYQGGREDALEKEYKEWSEPWGRVRPAMGDTHMNRVAMLGEPSGGKFNYPFEKRRTQKNVETLRSAEANLDKLWTAIDQIILAKAGDLPGSAVKNLLSQLRILHRTKEWVEPAPAPAKPKPAATATTDLDIYSFFSPISQIYSGSSALKLDTPQLKSKVKTRGTPQPPPITEPPAEPPNTTIPDHQPTFPVNSRALKVFRTLFFNPDVTSTPGEIPWTDFLHAMTSVGFEVMKLYGSVWQFQPTKLDVERGIQFHEPHPKGKVPFTVARRFGRRLNRAYGWVGGMFVLEK
ncbi:hypothetical protein BDW59DRAFT_149106 [Aspergillus cavernicola]|uniref:Uncharacterized protein n=1 Tax=Aspergillus cavernicola TaxID=176166 RepID=A0ABR4I553_9EURO